MINKYFKKYKLNQLQKIKQTYKYIYIYRYNDFTKNENISLKKKLNQLQTKSLVLKQNLINKIFLNIKGQGSILIVYSNLDINIIKELSNIKKIEFIYLISNYIIFSKLKLKKIFSKNNRTLNIIINDPILKFLHCLRNI